MYYHTAQKPEYKPSKSVDEGIKTEKDFADSKLPKTIKVN